MRHQLVQSTNNNTDFWGWNSPFSLTEASHSCQTHGRRRMSGKVLSFQRAWHGHSSPVKTTMIECVRSKFKKKNMALGGQKMPMPTRTSFSTFVHCLFCLLLFLSSSGLFLFIWIDLHCQATALTQETINMTSFFDLNDN